MMLRTEPRFTLGYSARRHATNQRAGSLDLNPSHTSSTKPLKTSSVAVGQQTAVVAVGQFNINLRAYLRFTLGSSTCGSAVVQGLSSSAWRFQQTALETAFFLHCVPVVRRCESSACPGEVGMMLRIEQRFKL